jgi:NitT/TauT family transport system substrate-binding protein
MYLKILATLVLLAASNFPSFAESNKKLEPITVAQFGHVFLYLPLYVAVDKGFFKEQGLDVKLISTGGDEKTFTAVLSGNAQFGVSDPVFAAIARERGQGGKVVASIVRGVPFWVVSFDNKLKAFDNASGFAGHRIATYTAPSTSYAVMKSILANNRHPVDAKLVQGAFGTLLALLKTNQADMALDIEPIVSIATNQGAHIVYSPASKLGEFAFTGLTVSDTFHAKHPDRIQAAVNALAKSMKFIEQDFSGTLEVAKKEFPEVPEPALREALKRLIKEGTIPETPILTKTAWDRSVSLRKEIGDLKGGDAKSGDIKSLNSFEQNVDMSFAAKAGH